MPGAADVNELEHRLRATVRANSTSASGSHAPREIKRGIARRRALTVGSMGGAAAVILGSVAIGGWGLAEPPQLAAPSPTPDLSIDQGSRAYATVDLPADPLADDYLYDASRQWCGGPAPAPSVAAEDFSAVFDVPETLDLDRIGTSGGDTVVTGHAQLTYEGEEPLPAFTGIMTALLVQDGTVVGIGNSDQPTMQTFEPDMTRIATWRWHGWMAGCGDSPTSQLPPAGDYEVVFVAQVRNDQASAAKWSLQRQGYGLPPANAIADFQEGSFRCSQWERWGMYKPLTCNPAALVGFDIDEAAGTADVPYETEFYVRDVDVTVASQPVPATLGPEPQFGHGPSLPALEPGTEPLCGTVYGDFGDQGGLSTSWPTLRSTPVPGDTITTTVWMDSLGWEQATVAVPTDPRIWVARMVQVETSVTEGVISYGQMGREVIGWIDTTSPASQSPLQFSSYDGPRDWDLTVTDTQWCEDPAGEPIENVSPSDQALGIILAPIDITLDDNPGSSATALVLNPSLGW